MCKGRIPSFLPQPLVETRRMQRPPGRSAAASRAAGDHQPPPQAQYPAAVDPRPPLPGSQPLPRQEWSASPSHPAAQSQETPGGRCPSFLQPQIRAKGAPPGGGPSTSPPGSFPGDPSLRLIPSPLPDFTASKVPHSPHYYGSPASEEGVQARVGAGFSSDRPWLTAQKGPCPDR